MKEQEFKEQVERVSNEVAKRFKSIAKRKLDAGAINLSGEINNITLHAVLVSSLKDLANDYSINPMATGAYERFKEQLDNLDKF